MLFCVFLWPSASCVVLCFSVALLSSYPVSMKTVAVIGASSNRGKYGNKALRAFERQGFHVIAINPNEHEVEGHRTYPSVLDVPDTPLR